MAARARLGAFALCAAAVVIAPRAGADQPAAPPGGKAPVDEARDRYRRGVRLYEEGDYPAALVEFRRAYELSPAFQVLYNIGHVYRQLQNYAEALRWLEKYLQDGGRNLPQARADEVQREVDELRRRVAQLDVVCEVPGATVFVDDELVGETPLGKQLRVSAGRRRLKVQKAGYNVFEQSFEVAGAEVRSIRVQLVETIAAVPASSLLVPRGPEREPWHRWTTLSWVGLGAAGALAVGGAVTGSLAYRDATDVRDSSKEGPVDGDVRERSGQAKGLAVVSDVLLGAAVLTAGVTLTLTLVRSPPSAADARSNPAPWALGLGPGGMGLRHTF
jgi:PEGA domain/Tetratricopeptide repeat